MSYSPYLKIGYRKGVDNGMADLLSIACARLAQLSERIGLV